MLPAPALPSLILFMALTLAAVLHGLAASGHFPLRRHPGVGPTILFGSLAIVVACIAEAIAAAVRLIPWYAAVIGGGLSILLAPLVLQQLPDRFVDGRSALIAFSAASLACALLLMWMTMWR